MFEFKPMSHYQKITHCVLCQSPATRAATLFSLNPNQKLLCCRNCGLVFNDNCRDDHEVIYNDDYFETSEKPSPGGYFAYDGMEKAVQKTYGFATRYITQRTRSSSDHIRLLDIGCGYGFFLKQFKDNPHIQLFGVEISVKAAKEASKYVENLYRETAENISFTESFDVVVAFELIEHLLDPPAFLKKAHHFLRDDGRLFLSTPDVGSLWFRLLKKRWPGIHPNYHNVYFSRKTLRQMADLCGFEVVHIHSRPFFYTNICHVRRRLSELFPLIGRCLGLLKPLDACTIPFLNGGDLQVVLKKKSRHIYSP